MNTIVKSRLYKVNKLALKSGGHKGINDGLCVMEAVAYVAREPWSDHPQCACPVIAAFMRSWNDGMRSDEERELLKPLIPLLVDSKSTPEIENKRAWMACDWLVRTHCPAFLELAGLEDHANALRGADELVDDVSANKSSAAWSAARSAAWSAAMFAAWSAARSAAWSAAESAAWSAALFAAESAALFAARSAAMFAASEKLESTVKVLQLSALELVRRMLETQ